MQKPIPMDFGTQYQKVRKDKNLTQNQMAEQINMSKSAYSELETNKTEPKPSKILQNAKELNIPLYQLLPDNFLKELLKGLTITNNGEINSENCATQLFINMGEINNPQSPQNQDNIPESQPSNPQPQETDKIWQAINQLTQSLQNQQLQSQIKASTKVRSQAKKAQPKPIPEAYQTTLSWSEKILNILKHKQKATLQEIIAHILAIEPSRGNPSLYNALNKNLAKLLKSNHIHSTKLNNKNHYHLPN